MSRHPDFSPRSTPAGMLRAAAAGLLAGHPRPAATTPGAERPPVAVQPTLASLAGMRGRPGAALAAAGESGGGQGGVRPGRGLEYRHSRRQVPGDDARHIDWPTSARRGSLHTRVYHDDRRVTRICLVDGRAGMRFGTRGAFKWSVAAHAAATDAWLALDGGGRAGLVLADGLQPRVLPATATARGLLAGLRVLADHRAAEAESVAGVLDAGLEHAARLAGAGGEIRVYSDLADAAGGLENALARAAARCRAAVVWIHDPLEREPPPTGVYPVRLDGRRQRLVVSGADRSAWRHAFEQRRARLAALVRNAGAAFVEYDTESAARRLAIR